MQLTKAYVRRIWKSDKSRHRKALVFAIIITAVVFFICLGFKYGTYESSQIFIPKRYYHTVFANFEYYVSGIFKGRIWHEREELITEIGVLDWVMGMKRLEITVMAAVSGAGLALAGGIFQTIYKNPMASPSMLGATAGVQLGNVIMVMLYSQSALVLIMLRYKWCYILTAICVAAVLLLGRIAGDRTGNPSVLKMVMAGSIINQGLGTFAMFYMYQLPEEDLYVYQQLMMGTYIDTKNVSMLVFGIVMAGGLIPMFLLRYRMNVTGLDDVEARVAGINPMPYRLAGQICGVLLVTAALIHCGEAGMLTMVLPYVVRSFVGSDTKKLFFVSAFSGASLLMICRTISTTLVLRNGEGDALLDANGEILTLPVTFIVNICLLPFFMVILARQRSAFE